MISWGCWARTGDENQDTRDDANERYPDQGRREREMSEKFLKFTQTSLHCDIVTRLGVDVRECACSHQYGVV